MSKAPGHIIYSSRHISGSITKSSVLTFLVGLFYQKTIFYLSNFSISVHPTPQLTLRPLFFEVPSTDNQSCFSGRQWLMREMEKALESSSSGKVSIWPLLCAGHRHIQSPIKNHATMKSSLNILFLNVINKKHYYFQGLWSQDVQAQAKLHWYCN